MPFKEWKNGLVWLTTPMGMDLPSPILMEKDTYGFWPLPLRDVGQHPLF